MAIIRLLLKTIRNILTIRRKWKFYSLAIFFMFLIFYLYNNSFQSEPLIIQTKNEIQNTSLEKPQYVYKENTKSEEESNNEKKDSQYIPETTVSSFLVTGTVADFTLNEELTAASIYVFTGADDSSNDKTTGKSYYVITKSDETTSTDATDKTINEEDVQHLQELETTPETSTEVTKTTVSESTINEEDLSKVLAVNSVDSYQKDSKGLASVPEVEATAIETNVVKEQTAASKQTTTTTATTTTTTTTATTTTTTTATTMKSKENARPPPEESSKEQRFLYKSRGNAPDSVQKAIRDNMASSNGLKSCGKNPPSLTGPINVNQNITPSMEEVIKVAGADLSSGGCYTPTMCQPVQKVAIIIPFKDREEHLKALLYYLHPMLKRQRIQYCIYVAEQYDTGQFNKAMIMNAAFEEAMKLDNYDCIVFHDVDMIPEDDRNMYICTAVPKHLSPAIDKFKYLLHYGTEFGGVTATRAKQYRQLNGHSNQFWGWGGEDNDMEYRIAINNLTIAKSNPKYGRYRMIPHLHSWKFAQSVLPARLNETVFERAESDGLSDLDYRFIDLVRHPLYTKLYIDIRRIEVTSLELKINGKVAKTFELKEAPCRWENTTGKYLDLVIELTNVKEIQNMTMWPGREEEMLAYGQPRTYGELGKQMNEEGNKKRFANVHSLEQAKELCEILHPLCNGILKEGKDNYSLRKVGKPRHLTQAGTSRISSLQDHDEKIKAMRKLPVVERMGFTRYCPGQSSDVVMLQQPLKMSIEDAHKEPVNQYSFIIKFNILMTPAKYIYYRDEKEFESQYKLLKNRFIFSWPHGIPKVTENDHPSHTFETPEFPIANIPGTYSVASSLEDGLGQPYFKWNWWFDLTTGDRCEDALMREDYYRKMVSDNMAWKKRRPGENENKSQHFAKQRANAEEFERQMAELKKQSIRNSLRLNQVLSQEEKERIEAMVINGKDDNPKK